MTVTLPGLLQARAREQPARPALICDNGTSLSFAEWDAGADATARDLLARGLATGDRVGLLFGNDRWPDYAVTFLGVLRAGGVAVPLPARQSEATRQLMAEDCGARWILDEPIGPGPATSRPNPLLNLTSDRPWRLTPPSSPVEAGGETGAAQVSERSWRPTPPSSLVEAPDSSVSFAEPVIDPDGLAQILYTSGTTGRPKGVAASHANLAYGHRPHPAYRMLSHSEHFLHAFPIGTNAGQMMLVNALVAHPCALVMAAFDAERCCALIEEHRVGTVFVVPSMAANLLDSGVWRRHDLSSVLLLSSSADALPPRVAAALPEAFPKATIVNYYTSTEAVPAQTTMIVNPARPHSVGRATEAGGLLITDEDGSPVAPGEVGEVWLRAPAAQRAYYGDAQADAQASARVFRRGWTRMGDLGYLDRDGYLYLVGRDSDVIKSGGLKISTLQIETALAEHPSVADAAVLGVPHPVMGSMVAAAIVPRRDRPPSIDELRVFLSERVARNEVPTRYAFVDQLPRNELGKVVKGELRDLFTTARREAGAALETAEQQSLARLWSAVLGVPVNSRDDDFFALGGDSLKASQLATRAGEEFGVELPGTLAFDHPILERQATELHNATARHFTKNPDVVEPGLLGGVQEHWWRWMHATPETRHMPPVHVAVHVETGLDADLLTRCLTELVNRHEALRTVFHDGRAVIHPTGEIRLSVHEAPNRDEAGALAADLVRTPFDITRGPLLRAALIRLLPGGRDEAAERAAGAGLYRDCGPTGGAGGAGSPGSVGPARQSGSPNAGSTGVPPAILVLAAHHMVFDGWSAGVLLRELGVLYSAFGHGAPSPLRPATQYADFVAFERREWSRTRSHWTATLADAPQVLPHFPGRAPDVRLCAAESHEFEVPGDAVGKRARATGSTTAMVLAAAWAQTLGEWSGSPEVVLASPVTGRTRPEFESTIGCLFRWNLLRVRTDGDVLAQVRNATLTANDHQFHNFARLHELVPYPAYVRFESWGHPARLPGLPSTEFPIPAGPIMEWPLAPDDPDTHPPELLVREAPDGSLTGSVIFNRHAYRRADMAELARTFTAMLS
ncbi:AMP-binding protein [Acrocarpospora catenulata]|uniref:AMP-binding protein n=1 Tax=Acrocarpospora catenulata TaxID=2836182 RepID=UPI001BD97E9C|nr:AMP-binding protein [Acrocarpospora catenulata]